MLSSLLDLHPQPAQQFEAHEAIFEVDAVRELDTTPAASTAFGHWVVNGKPAGSCTLTYRELIALRPIN